VVDLSLTLENGMDVYPGDPKVNIKLVHALEKVQSAPDLIVSMPHPQRSLMGISTMYPLQTATDYGMERVRVYVISCL
jgi:hypothetical protein